MTPSDTGQTTNRREFLQAIAGAGTLGLAGAALPGKARAGPGQRDKPARQQETSQTCQLPLFTDEYLGFRVGRPQGWAIEYAGGIIWQAPPVDATAPEDFQTVAFVYPGRTQETGIESVASEFVAAIHEALSPEGSLAMTLGNRLSGRLGTERLVGHVWTETRDTYALLWGGFGIPAAWERDRESVAATGYCFDIIPGEALKIETVTGQDQFGQTTYQYVVPESWTVSGLNSVGIDIIGEVVDGVPRAHVGYGTYSMPWQWSVQQAVRTWLDQMRQFGFNLRVRNGWDLGTTRDPLGYEWQQVLLEYDRNAMARDESGQRYVGYQTIAVLSVDAGFGSGWSTTLSWGREALTDHWDRLAAITLLVQSNIQIVSRRPGQLVSPSVAQTNSEISDIIMDTWETRNAASDRMQEQFVDMIWERDRVQNPANPGQQALVPTSSANPALCGGNTRPVYNAATDQWECWPLVE